MIRKAFSLIELFLVIALSGAMIIIAFNFIDTQTLSKEQIKTQLQSHFNIITATILQCKELSNMMPLQNDGSSASNTLLNTLECNTTIPYALDGEKGGFIPAPLNNFTPYTATQNGDEFYFSTTAPINSFSAEALQELQSSYSTNQYSLTDDATTTYLNFYLSR